jgi:hypothetical protein
MEEDILKTSLNMVYSGLYWTMVLAQVIKAEALTIVFKEGKHL